MSRSAFNQPINLIGPKITTSDFTTGPPSSPSDGDIWVGTNVDTNGTRWMFQYNAGSSSAYKWEFVGGAPYIIETLTGNGFATGAYNNIGWGYKPTRAGDYICAVTLGIANSTTAQSFGIGVGVGSTTSVNNLLGNMTISASWDITMSGTDRINGVAANTQLWLNAKAYSSGTGCAGQSSQFTAIPVRIS